MLTEKFDIIVVGAGHAGELSFLKCKLLSDYGACSV